MDDMTDYQFEALLRMLDELVKSCKDIKEAAAKIEALLKKGA